MKKIKQFIAKHWINVALIVFVGTVSWYSIQYAKEYSASAKTTNDIRSIWQLAITAIAGSVGIGTIINSTRSASSAAESIRINREKELREQSSHLIASSSYNKFYISPPVYDNQYEYHPKKVVKNYYNQEKVKFPNKSETTLFIESMEKIYEKNVGQTKFINYFKVLNIGKGASINIEYSFEFVNRSEFNNYELCLPSENKESEMFFYSAFPSYDIKIETETDKLLSIEVKDNFISEYITTTLKAVDRVEIANHFSVSNIKFIQEDNAIKYADFLKPGEDIDFPIPNDFMILCKHYALLSHYEKNFKNGVLPEKIHSSIEHLINGQKINPIGRITILYFDEETVRNNTKKNHKKKKLYFELKLKKESIFQQENNIMFYLEITPVSSD